PSRPRRLLLCGRGAARPGPARQAVCRWWAAGEPWSRLVRIVHGAAVRRALGHAYGPGGTALPRSGRGAPELLGLSGGLTAGVGCRPRAQLILSRPGLGTGQIRQRKAPGEAAAGKGRKPYDLTSAPHS